MKNITKITTTFLFVGLVLSLAVSFSAITPVDAINRDKADMITEIERKLVDINKELEEQESKELNDKKEVLTFAKVIIYTQDEIAKENSKPKPDADKIGKLNEELTLYLSKMKVHYPRQNDTSIETEASPDSIVDKLMNIVPEAMAADDYMVQSRNECQLSTAVTSGSITAYSNSVSYYAHQYYPGHIYANSNCSGGSSDLDVHAIVMWNVFNPGNLCYHDWSTTTGSISESCTSIHSGDIVILTSEGFYEDNLMYWPFPMTDSFWL